MTSEIIGRTGAVLQPRAFDLRGTAIKKIERYEYDEYRGSASELIMAGIVHAEQFPPVGRQGISYLRGKAVRGNHKRDETYLRIEHAEEGALRVYVGVPVEEAEVRKAVANAQRRREWEADQAKERVADAAKARQQLARVPRTEDEYRRQLAKQFRGWLRIGIGDQDAPSSSHGYRLDRESMEAVLIASDAIIEAVMQSTVHFDAELQARVIDALTATVKAADPSFYAQLEKLAAPNASLLEGEQS